jgi:hypothetical protein
MTPFTLKAYILLISKTNLNDFVSLNALNVKLQNLMEVQRQHNKDQKSCVLNCKLV